MVEIGSIGQAQAGGAVEAAPKPAEVKKAAKASASTRIEPVLLNDSTSETASKILGEVNQNLKIINADLTIEIDDETDQVIFKVIDLDSGETIKQIPSKELIRIAKKLKLIIESYSNNDASSTQLFMDSAFFV